MNMKFSARARVARVHACMLEIGVLVPLYTPFDVVTHAPQDGGRHGKSTRLAQRFGCGEEMEGHKGQPWTLQEHSRGLAS